MIRLFLGYDRREAIGFNVCVQSILENTDEMVQIVPLMGARRDGTNDFTYARFLVPYLCDFEGVALFIDGSDMLLRDNLGHLFDALDSTKAVSVVKHDYKTRHSRKYIGTEMESDNRDYPRKNWSSVMLFNCAHPANRVLTPEFIDSYSGEFLHRLSWLEDDLIGALDPSWNVLIGEDGDDKECALAHFTLGIPAFEHYEECRYAHEWRAYLGDYVAMKERQAANKVVLAVLDAQEEGRAIAYG